MEKRERYYSPRLREKLGLLLSSNLSVVEAPSGYGKTSAVYDSLRHLPPEQIYYNILVDESAVVNYRRLCRELSKLDPQNGAALARLGYPNRANEEEIISLIQNLKSDTSTYLIIDNFHYLQRDISTKILRAFTETTCANLHVILISLDLSSQIPGLQSNPHVNLISTEELHLTVEEIIEYYASAGFVLSEEDAETIYEKTGGWVVAISLYLDKVSESGQLALDADLFEVLDEVFWQKIHEERRLILLPFAIFDSLSMQSLSEMLDTEGEEAKIKLLLLHTPLMQFSKRTESYYPHPILSGFLKNRLEQYPENYQKQLYSRSGALHASKSRPFKALECYYIIRDYDAILSSPLELLEYQTIAGKDFSDIALEILADCPNEIKAQHPLALLKLAYYLYNVLNIEAYHQAMEEAKAIIWAGKDKQLQGEWYLMSAFYHFPNLEKMYVAYQNAASLLQTHSAIFTKHMPYQFGVASQWLIFYVKAGTGDAIATELSEVMKLYTQLTNNHGKGADILFRGELAAMRCEFKKAEIFAYEASYLAAEMQNVALAYGVALLLGRIAISKMDMHAFEKAIEYLETKASTFPYMRGSQTNQVLLESLRSMLLSMLGRVTEMSEWTNVVGNGIRHRGVATLPLAFVSGADNYLQGEVTRVLGLMEAIEKNEYSVINDAMRYFTNIVMCMAYDELNEKEIALEKLDQALTLAAPDDLLASIIHYRKRILPLLKDKKLRAKHRIIIGKIEALSRNIEFSQEAEAEDLALGKLPTDLSPREEEIAKLAAQGLRNREIAERLFISEWTVKNHIKSIYTKLSIDRRSKLIELLN